MEKIRKKINTKKRFDKMLNVLVTRILENKPISNNAMLDGMIIGLMLSTESFTRDLFLDREMGRVLDGTIQKLEQIAVWAYNNEDELCKIL